MSDKEMIYTTGQAAEHVGLTPTTFRKYLRNLEEYYPHIQRDSRTNYRIFNKYNLAVVNRMIVLTNRKGWTVKAAAEQASNEVEDIYSRVDDQQETHTSRDTEANTDGTQSATHTANTDIAGNDELLQILRNIDDKFTTLTESNKRLHEENQRLHSRLDDVVDELKDVKGERDQLLLETDNESHEDDVGSANVDDVEPVEDDQQATESMSDYNSMEISKESHKKKPSILGRLFGRK